MKKQETSGDPVVEKMIAKIRERSRIGQAKYGDTMQGEIDKDIKNFVDYLEDILEEMYDCLIYAEALKQAMKKEGIDKKLFKDD